MPEDHQKSKETDSTNEDELRARKTMRVVMSWWAIGGGLLFILFFRDWNINGIWAPYLGYALIGIGALSLAGVNLFWGGPLDKNRD